jgi:PAS domain S-box-containing protein
MMTVLQIYFILLMLSTAVAIALLIVAWRERDIPLTRPFMGLMLLAAVWSSGIALGMLWSDEAMAIFWDVRLRMVAVAWVPVLFLWFVMEYVGYERWLTPGRFFPLFIVPTVASVAALTAPTLLYRDISVMTVEGWQIVQTTGKELVFWLQYYHGYALMIAAFVLLLGYAISAPKFYRTQAMVVLVGAAIAFVGNVLTSAVIYSETDPDLTPISFAAGALVWAWALFRHKFLQLSPIAYRRVFQGMNEMVFVLDHKGQIADANPAAEALVQQPVEKLTGKSILDVFPSHLAVIDQYRTMDEGVSEIDATHLNGQKPIFFEAHVSPLNKGDKVHSGRLLVLHDITERKLAEIERERLIEDLNAYAHTVAHDLKTPLSVLIGYSDLLHMGDPKATVESILPLLANMHETSERMVRIIDELLLFASVREMEDIEIEPLNMSPIVTNVNRRFTSMAHAYGAQISIDADLPSALGYAPWVEEIWANYISNAIKYGGEPAVIRIGGTHEGDHVRYWVQDNGKGLSQEERNALFTKFTRFDRLRADGHGLGLSIVLRIAERLNGTVSVESVAEGGSLFAFTLPTNQSS